MNGRAILAGLALLLSGAVIGSQMATVQLGPRLAGYGCLGAGGPIYADEESDFPPCAQIVALYGKELSR
jgi:hypothetical protein